MPDTLSYAVYYGATRGMSAKDLQKYDVIVTTYQTVVGDLNGSEDTSRKKRKKDTGSLFGVAWKVRFFHSSRSLNMRGVCSDMNLAYCPRRGP